MESPETPGNGALAGGEAIAAPPPAATGLSRQERWDRKIDTIIVVILAVASLLAAWGGYQAGLWNRAKTDAVTAAEASQIEATRASAVGYQQMQIDIAMELNWLRATREGDADLATFYESRFSLHLARAFTAWLETNPLANASAPLDPFAMPEYQVPELQAAAEFDEAARRSFVAAETAGATGDAYVLATLLLAVVLFFAGVCTKIGWRPAQLTLLALSLLLLLYSVRGLGALPDASDWGLTPIWG